MANIIRCALPDGNHRFKPFTVADYRDFLLVRNDMEHRTPEEQKEILSDIIDDYFSEFPKTWRPFIFLHVFAGSIGKTKMPVAFTCPECGKKKSTLFNIHQKELKCPEIEVAGIKIKFNFPEVEYDDPAQMITENIASIFYNKKWIPWNELTEENQLQIIDAIDIDSLEKILEQMIPINLELKMHCCKKHDLKYNNILDVFKLLLNPDEVFTFYQINHMLVKSQYDLNSIMNMIPVERGIALALIEKDTKK